MTNLKKLEKKLHKPDLIEYLTVKKGIRFKEMETAIRKHTTGKRHTLIDREMGWELGTMGKVFDLEIELQKQGKSLQLGGNLPLIRKIKKQLKLKNN